MRAKAWTAVLLIAVCAQAVRAADDPERRDDSAAEAVELGLRFTPEMAEAQSRTWMRYMKTRYELSDDQADQIQRIMSRRLLEVVRESAPTGRELVEQIMTNSFDHNGGEPKFSGEDGQRFARSTEPLFPILDRFFTETPEEISQKMTLGQRLKFTADVMGARAGLGLLETRMKRWSEGKVGEHGNPFWDPNDDKPEPADAPPDDPNEHPDHREARQQVERWIEWQFKPDERWEQYVKNAIEYYGLNEAQVLSAQSILSECRDRARAIMTPEWKAAAKEEQIISTMAGKFAPAASEGPLQHQLSDRATRRRAPFKEIGDELRRRIEALPDSTQRASAHEKFRAFLAERGVDLPPD